MKIHELITPETWCKGSIARDNNDGRCSVGYDGACKWCANGWILKVYGSDVAPFVEAKLKIAEGGTTIPIWNDLSTFDEVFEAFFKADL